MKSLLVKIQVVDTLCSVILSGGAKIFQGVKALLEHFDLKFVLLGFSNTVKREEHKKNSLDEQIYHAS